MLDLGSIARDSPIRDGWPSWTFSRADQLRHKSFAGGLGTILTARYGDENIRGCGRADMQTTAFMRFWKTVNDILKSHSLPEMRYGEARGWWSQHQGQEWAA